MANFLKPIADIYNEWSTCTKCDLGSRRLACNKPIVAGIGPLEPSPIMIIGEGPGRFEEETGQPFVGKSGVLLREILDAYDMTKYCYFTNIVACRACEVVLEDNGQPKMRKGRYGKPDEVQYRDIVPTPIQIAACAPRLYEEIYAVDPVLIVAVGNTAASFLLGKPISILKERGITGYCEIPGAAYRPVLTDKKQAWKRKVKGVEVSPCEPTTVRYLVVPTLHPAYVLRKESDKAKDSPFSQLSSDLRLAGEIYERYMVEVRHKDAAIRHVELDEEAMLGGRNGKDSDGESE